MDVERAVCAPLCVLDEFIVDRAEQMGPHYQRVQPNRVQPTVTGRYLQEQIVGMNKIKYVVKR